MEAADLSQRLFRSKSKKTLLSVKIIKSQLQFMVSNIIESQDKPLWEGPWKIIWSNLSWEWEPRWDYLACCAIALQTLFWWGLCHIPFQWMVVGSQWHFCDEMKPVLLLPVFSTSLWRKSLCSLCSCVLSTGILWWLPQKLSLLKRREKRSNTFSLSSQGRSPSPLLIFKVVLRSPSGFSMSLLNFWDQSWTQWSRCSLRSAE